MSRFFTLQKTIYILHFIYCFFIHYCLWKIQFFHHKHFYFTSYTLAELRRHFLQSSVSSGQSYTQQDFKQPLDDWHLHSFTEISINTTSSASDWTNVPLIIAFTLGVLWGLFTLDQHDCCSEDIVYFLPRYPSEEQAVQLQHYNPKSRAVSKCLRASGSQVWA